MELDDTEKSLRAAQPAVIEETLDGGDSSGLAERFEGAVEAAEAMGFETRRQQALIAAALFDEAPVPVRIDRFIVIRELGAGGMGVVYIAYDEQLDRKVAVKLLRGADPAEDAQSRLKREAIAMARLQHPNVVTVHEVGTFEGQVFVAMEFVAGQDLRGWMHSHGERDWRGVVGLFMQAGEGLAAAHEVGLVHRDFKPDNVLVGDDGRARVADFGLAHALEAQPQMAELNLEDSMGNVLDTPLTKTGAIMGTPAYMAPEQYAGIRSDARGDQFSFCVALWEALYGQRPFSGTNLFTLSDAISAGRIDEPGETSEVPPWLRAVVTRGLAPKPGQRWPSMRSLLDALADDPQARRRRFALWSGLGSATLALVGGLTWLAATQLQDKARHSYWSDLTEQLLEIERERGLRQANDDATRARDATRMSVLHSYKPSINTGERDDPTIAAILLREVEGEARDTVPWLSAANELLGQHLSHQVLQGHRDGISAIVFSSDGETLYSASVNGEVRRWDLASGTGSVVSSHAKLVTELALSADGQFLASSSDDGTVRVWSVRTQSSRVLARHERPVMGVDFDPSGRWLATASKDGSVQVHDLVGGDPPVYLEGSGGPVYTVRFEPGGERLVTGSGDAKLRVWDVGAGRLARTLVGHEQAIFHIRVLDDGRIVSASDDGTTRLWKGDSGRILARHAAPVTALDVRGEQLVSAAIDGSLFLSALDRSTPSRPLPSHGDAIWSVVFTPDSKHIISASFDGTARAIRTDGEGVARTFLGHRLALFRVAIDPSGRWLGTGSYDSDVRVWDLEREPLSVVLEGHADRVFSAEVDRGGTRIVTASHDGTARVWDGRDGSCLNELDGGKDKLNHALFSPDGSQVAAARTVGEVELWSLETGERRVFEGHSKSAWRLSFDASGELLASASFDETVCLWDVETGVLLHTLVGHDAVVTAVDLQPDGRRVASAGKDGQLRIWNTQSGALEAELAGHTGKISVLVRSPDGRTLATGSDDGTARLWPSDDSADGIILPGHEKDIRGLVFDARGTRVATASLDKRARIWDAQTGELLRTLSGHADGLWDVRFLPNERVLTISVDGTIRLWSLRENTLPLELRGHNAAVLDVEVFAGGQRAVSTGADGSVRLWRLDLLVDDRDQALEQLLAVTRHCLPLEQRMRELGEDLGEARRRLLECRGRG